MTNVINIPSLKWFHPFTHYNKKGCVFSSSIFLLNQKKISILEDDGRTLLLHTHPCCLPEQITYNQIYGVNYLNIIILCHVITFKTRIQTSSRCIMNMKLYNGDLRFKVHVNTLDHLCFVIYFVHYSRNRALYKNDSFIVYQFSHYRNKRINGLLYLTYRINGTQIVPLIIHILS